MTPNGQILVKAENTFQVQTLAYFPDLGWIKNVTNFSFAAKVFVNKIKRIEKFCCFRTLTWLIVYFDSSSIRLNEFVEIIADIFSDAVDNV